MTTNQYFRFVMSEKEAINKAKLALTNNEEALTGGKERAPY